MADASTIIGESILISGNLNGDEDLTILGRVHGTVTLSKTLTVDESGIVKADVEVRNAVISGIIVGNIVASDSVEILEAGRVVGDIKAPRVIIVDGARFRGNIDMGDLEAPRASGPMPARTVERSALARSTPSTSRTSSTSVPARRPTPSAPMSRPTSAPSARPSSAPTARPSAPPPPPAARPAAEAQTQVAAKPPMPGKKKLKKKVVSKK